MISPQPVFNLKYFHFRKNPLPAGIKRLFYLSWEDALWDILSHKKIKKGSTILVPDFYCTDVEKNIKIHGYKVSHYKILPNLSVDIKSFANSLKQVDPSVVVILNPVGIKSNLFGLRSRLTKLLGGRLLIEDSVHSIIDPAKISIYAKNHFIIDSLRKVIPLQGTQVFGKIKDMDFSVPPFYQSFWYSTKVHFLWFFMEACWTLGFYKSAEKLMLKGYDLIGDSYKPARGNPICNLFSQRINLSAINKIKLQQVKYYDQALGGNNVFNKSDRANLRGYPVILPSKIAVKVVDSLRKNGLPIRFELNGSAWSNRQKIIYLPLGFQMNKNKQTALCMCVKSALSSFK